MTYISTYVYKTQNEFVVIRKIDVWIAQILIKKSKSSKESDDSAKKFQ